MCESIGIEIVVVVVESVVGGVGSGEKGTSSTAFGREFTDNENSVNGSSLLGRAPLTRLTAARTRCVAHTFVRYDGRCKRASGRACLLSLFSRRR